jgi:nitroreductase
VRSVRDLHPDPIPDGALDAILEVARWTGSGMNRQPWTFVVVRDRTTLAAIADASTNTGHVANAGAAILLVMEDGMPGITTFDEGRAAERICIAATAEGLASALGWISEEARPAVAELLGVPQGRHVRTLISLGRATEAGARPKAAPGTARKPLADVVRYERYG